MQETNYSDFTEMETKSEFINFIDSKAASRWDVFIQYDWNSHIYYARASWFGCEEDEEEEILRSYKPKSKEENEDLYCWLFDEEDYWENVKLVDINEPEKDFDPLEGLQGRHGAFIVINPFHGNYLITI